MARENNMHKGGGEGPGGDLVRPELSQILHLVGPNGIYSIQAQTFMCAG